MQKLLSSEKGFGQWIILFILLVGIGVGVWVAQIRTNYFPQAKVKEENQILQTAVMSLSLAEYKPVIAGSQFLVNVSVRSDVDPIRLISSHLKFNPQDLEVVEVIATSEATRSAVIHATESAEQKTSKITQWVETLFDNKTGNITVSGLNEQGNLKTESSNPPFIFTQILFKAKTTNESTIAIEDSSLIIRAEDNMNVLSLKETITLKPIEATKSGKVKK
jgi:hypothetical protein